MWAKLNREAIEEYGDEDVMFFTRSGYLGIQQYAPILWNGGSAHGLYARLRYAMHHAGLLLPRLFPA